MVLYIEAGEAHFHEALLDYVRRGSFAVLESFFKNDNPDLSDSSGKTLLHYAAQSNNVSMTKHLIDNKYNVDSQDHYGNTPLMLAVQNDSVDTAKLLLDANADIYLRGSKGTSILPTRTDYKYKRHLFSEMSESEMLDKYRSLVKIILKKLRRDCRNDEKLLISRLIEVDCTLIKAIYLADPNVTRLMLQNGYSVDEREAETYETALHEAVKLGDYENVKVLIEFGANVDARDNDGLSPIYLYNRLSEDTEDKLKILRMLIEHDALSSKPPDECMTPSQFILQNGKLWAINTLMQYSFEWNPQYSLYALVSNQNPDVLEAVRDKNLDLNCVDNPTKSPVLSHSAKFGNLKKVQFLLESGADPNIIDKDGHTPFTSAFMYMFALQKGHLPIVPLMLQYGANAQYSSSDGRTVFDVAVQHGHENLLEPVIAHLAIIDSIGDGITPLIRSKIYSQETFKTHFETCKQQLEMMKNTAIYESVTMFKLLTETQSRITKYARNPEFAAKFRKNLKIKPVLENYYSISLRRRVGKAIHVAKLKEEAVVVMNTIFGYRINNYHEILSEIVDYLNCDDLKNVCKIYNLQESEPFHLDKYEVSLYEVYRIG